MQKLMHVSLWGSRNNWEWVLEPRFTAGFSTSHKLVIVKIGKFQRIVYWIDYRLNQGLRGLT